MNQGPASSEPLLVLWVLGYSPTWNIPASLPLPVLLPTSGALHIFMCQGPASSEPLLVLWVLGYSPTWNIPASLPLPVLLPTSGALHIFMCQVCPLDLCNPV
ncbi:hypothetical protein TREES_T100011893 [Tupaia chinensis]|uniref:Uncharacterized protein n=1 Tax=Tupaia chinensis TaxID=246437 RepID=L9KV09_TUPCH|nr:hypothetical protein TREES_T100011893 [Tupaia chinensis]